MNGIMAGGVTDESETDSASDKLRSRKSYHDDYFTDNIEEDGATGVQKKRFLDDHLDDVFEPVALNELKVALMGEIVSAEDFDDSPICVHYLFELPKGWKNDSLSSSLQGITNSCHSTTDSRFHFSFTFYSQLAFSPDVLEEDEMAPSPIIFLMAASMFDATRVKFKGYGYLTIPSKPGSYNMRIQTWMPKPRTIEEQMADCFLDVSPSLQDIRAVHIPYFEGEECRRANRLGLQTNPSGYINIRLHVAHQLPTESRQNVIKLSLMEKMSSAVIVKSVQTVIEAFQRARRRAEKAKLGKSSSSSNTTTAA